MMQFEKKDTCQGIASAMPPEAVTPRADAGVARLNRHALIQTVLFKLRDYCSL